MPSSEASGRAAAGGALELAGDAAGDAAAEAFGRAAGGALGGADDAAAETAGRAGADAEALKAILAFRASATARDLAGVERSSIPFPEDESSSMTTTAIRLPPAPAHTNQPDSQTKSDKDCTCRPLLYTNFFQFFQSRITIDPELSRHVIQTEPVEYMVERIQVFIVLIPQYEIITMYN